MNFKNLKKKNQHRAMVAVLSLTTCALWVMNVSEAMRLYDENKSITVENQPIELREETEKETLARICSSKSVICDGETIDDEVIELKTYELTGEFTAYNSEVGQTDSDPFTMANGDRVHTGAIACPRYLGFGSLIEVEGMGVFVCKDRMNIRYANTPHFDIWMENKSDALEFGRRELKYNILMFDE